jgi:hypothetical protein
MKSKPLKAMSAAELMARLRTNDEFVQQDDGREASRQLVEAQFRREEIPLLVALANVGYEVDSVWDLVNRKSSYPEAVPVLVQHLKQPYDSRIREGIIRALTVPEARGTGGRALLDELKSNETSDEQLRFALANALTVAADRTMAQEIGALAKDPRYVDVHAELRKALARLRSGTNADQ